MSQQELDRILAEISGSSRGVIDAIEELENTFEGLEDALN